MATKKNIVNKNGVEAKAIKKIVATPMKNGAEKEKNDILEIGLSAPWVTYQKELFNLLAMDPDLLLDRMLTEVGNGSYEYHISSMNYLKLKSLKKILKNEIKMGDITIRIIFDQLELDDSDIVRCWKNAFNGNPLFNRLETIDIDVAGGMTKTFAVFDREIISFFNDDISDYCGNKHMLVSDIVKDVMVDDNTVVPCMRGPFDPT